ncbi:MAG: molybdate ABC transporter substrate-binding protein [Vicinamibacterales bacterium]
MRWIGTLSVAVALSTVNVREPVTVSAAISLTNALETIAKAYADAGGGPLRFNFAGSNVLARQIVNGAPADLFISADEAQMDVAAHGGAIDSTSRVDLLANRLVVIASRSVARSPIRGLDDLLRPEVKRIALGDPSAVPAGVYARNYFRAVGTWTRLEPKIVPVANVRAALTVVENGSADAAIVYETDAALSTNASIAFVVAGPDAPRIVYPAALVARSRRPEAARQFLSFLRGSAASAIFRRFGFSPLTTAP